MTAIEQHEVVVQLHEAINHLMAVLVRLESLPAGQVPDAALDMALLASLPYQEAREAEWAASRSRRVMAFRDRGVKVRLDFGETIVVDFDPTDHEPRRDIEARVAIQQILRRLKAEKGAPN